MIRTVGMILNRNRTEAVRCAEQAALYMKGKGITSFDVQNELNSDTPDLIISFGGDGSLLIGARYALEYDIPLLGINLGTVGFLTEEEPKRLEEALQAIINGEY